MDLPLDPLEPLKELPIPAPLPEYNCPSITQSFGPDQLPNVLFHIELRGTLLVAARTPADLRARDAVVAQRGLRNGGVPGLPGINAEARASLFQFRDYLDGRPKRLQNRDGALGRMVGDPWSVAGMTWEPWPLRTPSQLVDNYGDILVVEDSVRDNRNSASWQITYAPFDLANNDNANHIVPNSFWTELPHSLAGNPPLSYEMTSVVIISPDFLWADQRTWRSNIDKLYRDLRTQPETRNIHFDFNGIYPGQTKNNLSVHIMSDGEFTIDNNTLQQALILYGLKEDTIEDWMQTVNQPPGDIEVFRRLRPSRPLRLGPEKIIVDKLPIAPPSLVPGTVLNFLSKAPLLGTSLLRSAPKVSETHRGFTHVDTDNFFYSHEEFARAVYQILRTPDMKTKLAGCGPELLYSDGTPRPYGKAFRDGTTVNISESDPRSGKPMTLEFLHHSAGTTASSSDIAWWIKLCARIFQYGAFLAKMRINSQDPRVIKQLVDRNLAILIALDGPEALHDPVIPLLPGVVAPPRMSEVGRRHFGAFDRALRNAGRNPPIPIDGVLPVRGPKDPTHPITWYKRKRRVDHNLITRRKTKSIHWNLSAIVKQEIANLEMLTQAEYADTVTAGALPADLPFVTDAEWPEFTRYLNHVEAMLRSRGISLLARPISVVDQPAPFQAPNNGRDTASRKIVKDARDLYDAVVLAYNAELAADRLYLSTTVLNTWIDITGLPRLRRARLERGWVPEHYTHTSEMKVDWSQSWLLAGERPDDEWEVMPLLVDGIRPASKLQKEAQYQTGLSRQRARNGQPAPEPNILGDIEPDDDTDMDMDLVLLNTGINLSNGDVMPITAWNGVWGDFEFDNNPYQGVPAPGESLKDFEERIAEGHQR